MKGGIINAKAGGHNCAIGAACGSYVNGANGAGHKKYAKNIRIEGGIVTAEGGENCAGIGGGNVTSVDGIYITGGTVYASEEAIHRGLDLEVQEQMILRVLRQYRTNVIMFPIS